MLNLGKCMQRITCWVWLQLHHHWCWACGQDVNILDKCLIFVVNKVTFMKADGESTNWLSFPISNYWEMCVRLHLDEPFHGFPSMTAKMFSQVSSGFVCSLVWNTLCTPVPCLTSFKSKSISHIFLLAIIFLCFALIIWDLMPPFCFLSQI